MPDPVFASVDLGGTNIAAAIGDEAGRILASEQVATQSQAGPQVVLQRIADLVLRLAEQVGQQPSAIGMAVPGLCDPHTGVVKFLPNLPTQWREVPAGEQLRAAVGCPVRVLNDVRTATLGELRFGHGREHQTMAFFSIGTGIGGGVAIKQQLHLGPLGAAGELGHQTVLIDGPRCGCGNRGCLETLASGPAISAAGVRLLQSGLAPALFEITGGDAAQVSPMTMAKAAEQGDELVSEAIHVAATYLGIGVANVVVTLHPDLIVIGGGVARLGSRLISPVRREVSTRVGMFPTDDIEIKISALGDQAGVLGGLALAMHGVTEDS